ncbi:MAG TPA: TIGR00725 family protein [Longimicrobiales bacterium]
MTEAAPLRVAVIGGARATEEDLALAHEVGRGLGDAGAVLVCGGMGGVMEAAARGCREAGGLTVGLLPGADPQEGNSAILLPLATGLGVARNALVVRAGEAVIAVGGEWGTLSEIALARAMGRVVVTLGTPPAEGLALPAAASAEEAVAAALDAARQAREGWCGPDPPPGRPAPPRGVGRLPTED